MIEKLACIFSDFQPRVLFAYLFGSTGTALQHARSDLDLAIYLDKEASAITLDHKLTLYTEISRAIKRNDIDVVILNTCDNCMLLYELMINGRLIYDVNPNVRILFEQKTLHAAIDFKEQRDRIFAW